MPHPVLRRSNDNTPLVARTEFPGPWLELDFPSLHIGVAEYDEGPTGCTVFYFPSRTVCETDVRGGAPGVINFPYPRAICLTGGSAYGLEAAAGVTAEILARAGYTTSWDEIGVVNAAVIFDLGVRDNVIYPDKELGRAALRAAAPGRFPQGQRGAGRGGTVGKAFDFAEREPGGQGGAFRQLGPVRIAVFTVLNSVGAIVDRQGRVVRGYLDPETGGRHTLQESMERAIAKELLPSPGGNTTLTLVVTNQMIDPWSLRQLGRQVHVSMARGIQPFHCRTDGDVLFAVTTNEAPETVNPSLLALIASELAWDAILAALS